MTTRRTPCGLAVPQRGCARCVSGSSGVRVFRCSCTARPCPFLTCPHVPLVDSLPQALPVLYDFPLAYNPAKPRLILLEKGAPYTTRFTNLFNGQSLSPAFLRVNPAGTVPALALEGGAGKTLTESLQIVRYVDASLGGAPLGGGSVDRDFIQKWGDQVCEVTSYKSGATRCALGGERRQGPGGGKL